MVVWLRIAAVFIAGMGAVWVLQGVNILPGSFMTGDIRWAWRGAFTIAIGIVLWLFSLRMKSAKKT
jgi:hypothetical protein